ncbi:SMP-30/gluconolactonase/LRE family protein [Streptomyces lincolnensis]|nr:SMP-30/gluconolactonase/LRE family protein [Streptomyces lincolnensis]QMV06869.1 SMP-30/gluconolactonase/LRE family protein [Streptomyces lincolnensis]
MRRLRFRPLAVLAALGTLALTGCGTDTRASGAGTAGPGRTVTAHQFMRLTTTHQATGMTLLEGPTFGADGRLNVVDVTAPAGEPKLIRVDVKRKTARTLFTDRRGAYTSAQFSPYDGRIYLSDFASGAIVSLAADGTGPRTFFSGEVDGARMLPDDIAFDRDGHLYVSDSLGMSEGEARGRVVRVDRDGGKATVLADGLAATNGIAFDTDHRGLWISELTENRISYLPVVERPGMSGRHTAVRVDGGIAQTDSIAVDADGNLYQALHGRPAMEVYSRYGEHLATVRIPGRTEGLESATNVAITPGGTKAYMTVSGPAGGYLYTFEALAKGVRQSNGG